jgi:4-hydroxybutyrate CoA-transferase
VQNQGVFNKIYPKRGLPFHIKDYPQEVQKIWQEKCRPVDEIVAGLPAHLKLGIGLLAEQPRQFLRALGKRKNFTAIELFSAFLLEPYEFLAWPITTIRCPFFFSIERMLNYVMKKTIHFHPLQFTQVPPAVKYFQPEYIVTSATVPNEEGYINLSLTSGVDETYLRQCLADPSRRVIVEINQYQPWVASDAAYSHHSVHLSQVSAVYENHEPLFQLPPIETSEREKKIAEYCLPYIKDGSTLQFGIGGVPNYIATQITVRRNLGIHSEMLCDGVVDLVQAGAISNTQKGHRDGVSVCTFILGTDKLYDWVDRNPQVCILPIHEVNEPYVAAKCNNFVSINAGLMVDVYGQICSDTFAYKTYSGFGGQLEFVQAAMRSPGGRSILCIKSTATVKDKPVSNVVVSFPEGTTVTVPRCFTDVVVTEYGVAELREKSSLERAHALVNIANPEFREGMADKLKTVGLWEESYGFTSTSQKVFYRSVGLLSSLKRAASLKFWLKKVAQKIK